MMRRGVLILVLAVVFSMVASSAVLAAPSDPEPEPVQDSGVRMWSPREANIPEATTGPIDCIASIVGLASSSVGVFITYYNPVGSLITVRRLLLTGTTITAYLDTRANCTSVTKVQEELWYLVRVTCSVAVWVSFPGAKKWYC